MNGILAFNDGAGTTIQGGVITSNELDVALLVVAELDTNLINAKTPSTSCTMWDTNTGVTNYSGGCSGTINLGNASTGNLNIGPIAGAVSGGALNIATSSLYSGTVTIGNSSAPSGKIKMLSQLVECNAAPAGGNSVVNKTYADGLITALRAATNVWTGVSNTFNNVVYCSLIQGISTLTLLADGVSITSGLGDVSISATTGNVYVEGITVNATSLQATAALATVDFFNSGTTSTMNIGNAGTLVSLGGLTTYVAKNNNYSHEFGAGSSLCYHDFHSYFGTSNDYDARIQCSGGVALTPGAGTMTYTAASHQFVNGGVCFDKGNLTGGSFIQTLTSITNGLVIAGNSLMVPNLIVTFISLGGVNFSTTPNVSVTLRSANTACSGVILSIYSKNNTRVVIQAYNANGTVAPAGAWGVEIIAIGGY